MIGFARLAVLAAGAATTIAAPAPARDAPQWTNVTPQDMGTAFKAICLDHPGDAEAQGAAGQAKPWNLKQQGPRDEKGRIGYRTGSLQLGATISRNANICAITTGLPLDTAITDLAFKISPLLGAGDPTVEDGKASWTATTPFGNKEVRLTTRQTPSLGVTIATILIIIDKTKAI